MNIAPRITFGMIVLNGEPFVRYNLRALYPFAHQIIVVEGAAPAAAGIATAGGHSRDGTLKSLKEFKAHEDPEDKLLIVTAEDEGHPNGFWPGEKHEQSQAYARRATGDYLWQVDVDEFYQPRDMQTVMEMLRSDPAITAVSFKTITFWGGFDYLTDGWYLRRGADVFHRLFQWRPGHRYTTHRPPTVADANGGDLRNIRWVDGEALMKRGIRMYHYSLLFPRQVMEKSEYYGRAEWIPLNEFQQWARDCFFQLGNPWRVHNVYNSPSWLARFTGEHPPQIRALQADIQAGKVAVELRQTADVERVLSSPKYWLGRCGLKFLDQWDRAFNPWQRLPHTAAVAVLALPCRAARKVWNAFPRQRTGPSPKAR